jgi:hypothetical protein
MVIDLNAERRRRKSTGDSPSTIASTADRDPLERRIAKLQAQQERRVRAVDQQIRELHTRVAKGWLEIENLKAQRMEEK